MMKRQTTKGLVLYEQVLQKNFEIIETFLNKFPLIFKKQDFFDDSIRKINEKLNKHDTDQQKIREDLQLSTAMLDKKIANSSGALRSNRSSHRVSQDLMPLEDRKNGSVFRVSAINKDPKEFNAYFSKQKMEMLAEIDKKQQEHLLKINELEETIQNLQQKVNFLSVLNSDLQSKFDHLIEAKVNLSQFQDLSKDYEFKFQTMINSLVNQRYHLGRKLIKQQVTLIERNLSKAINHLSGSNRKELLEQLQKKAGVSQFTEELGDIKTVIEKMVDQSVDSFASKQETKKALLLFEKKFVKLEVVLQELLTDTMKGVAQEQIKDCFTLGCQKEREGVMSNFGRRRKPCLEK